MLPASAVFFMVFRGFVLVFKLLITQKSVSPSGNSVCQGAVVNICHRSLTRGKWSKVPRH